MYSKNIMISIAVMMICAEAGVITNASHPRSEILSSDPNQKLQKFPKKYTDVSPDEYKKAYENTGKSSPFNKSWIQKNIPRLISDSELTSKVIQIKVFDSDVFKSEAKNINNNLQVATTIGDKVNNQQPNNDSVVEYLELDMYPNILDEKFVLSTKGKNHVLDSDDQIHKEQFNNTDAVFGVEGQYIDNEDINETEEEIAISQDKAEAMSDEQNINTNTTVSIKFEDQNVTDDEENDFDEFIFINNEDDVSEFATEINYDNFEITADLLIDEPRFKRAVNIIEEENLPTTLSGFQYTGRHKILINDLSYKNINS